MTAQEKEYFLANSAQVAYSEVDQEIESRLALEMPRPEAALSCYDYDDIEIEDSWKNEEEYQNIACKTLLELIE